MGATQRQLARLAWPKAIHWAVAGFVALLLSYFGVIFVHEIILGRA